VSATTVSRIPVRRILRDVGQSYRHRFGRVVIAAAIVFGASAVVGAAIHDLTHKAEPNFVVWVFALAGTAMSQIGITFYAGLLDKVVGEFELGEEPEPILRVLRTLPYGSLIVADILVTAATALGMLLLVLPGLVVFTLFAITGPVVNIEHVGALRGMRRSAQLVRGHFWLVFLLVSVPLIEVFVVQGVAGMVVGSFVGLVEVNVAYALELERPARLS
jgi:hypothetical protein